MKTLPLLALLLPCWMATLPARAEDPQEFQLAQQFVLGGDGGFDYLAFDPQSKQLLISRSTRVMVVDPYKGKITAEIPGTTGVHGIALAPEQGIGFTSNGKDDSVTVFDLKTWKETAKIKVDGANPDAILYDPATKRLFTFNGKSRDASVFDTTGKIAMAGKIPLGGKPEFAAADGKGSVYVNIEDTSELVHIDAAKAFVADRWKLAPCEEPSGLSMDRENRRLFVTCHNQLMAIVDADSGKLVATAPIGKGTDASAFDPDTKLAFSSNGDGTMTVVHEDAPNKFTVLQNAATKKGARTMAVDSIDHDVYLVTGDFEETPAKDGGRPQRTIKPGTFTLLVMRRK